MAAAPGVALANRLPAGGRLSFNVLRNGTPLGQYNVVFTGSRQALNVIIEANMLMKVGPVTVLDYRHHSEEQWSNGQFMGLSSRTVRDGVTESITVARTDNGIAITTAKGRGVAPSSANPLSHWNSAVLSGPLFNPQTGKMLTMTAVPQGRTTVALANGARVGATQWSLRGETAIDDWYDEAGVWAGLKGQLPDKSTMEYRRL